MAEWKPIFTSYPGKIIEFDPVKQVAKVEIAREQYHNSLDSLYEEYDFPILQDVPVQFPSGGGYSLTFPVNAGDNCLLMFCDKGYSHWLYGGKNKIGKFSSGLPKNEYFRRYNINDAVALVGYNPIPEAITSFNSTSPELRNSDRTQRVTLVSDGNIEVVAVSNLHITAPTSTIDSNVTINGTLHVTGKITSDDDVVAGTISLKTHRTSGVLPGSGTSSVPVV